MMSENPKIMVSYFEVDDDETDVLELSVIKCFIHQKGIYNSHSLSHT